MRLRWLFILFLATYLDMYNVGKVPERAGRIFFSLDPELQNVARKHDIPIDASRPRAAVLQELRNAGLIECIDKLKGDLLLTFWCITPKGEIVVNRLVDEMVSEKPVLPTVAFILGELVKTGRDFVVELGKVSRQFQYPSGTSIFLVVFCAVRGDIELALKVGTVETERKRLTNMAPTGLCFDVTKFIPGRLETQFEIVNVTSEQSVLRQYGMALVVARNENVIMGKRVAEVKAEGLGEIIYQWKFSLVGKEIVMETVPTSESIHPSMVAVTVGPGGKASLGLGGFYVDRTSILETFLIGPVTLVELRHCAVTGSVELSLFIDKQVVDTRILSEGEGQTLVFDVTRQTLGKEHVEFGMRIGGVGNGVSRFLLGPIYFRVGGREILIEDWKNARIV